MPSFVSSASYSPSGKWIITSCNEGVFIWDSQTRLCIDTLIGTYGTNYNQLHDHAIFDQNEQRVATWSYQGQGIILWNWNSNTAKSDSINAKTIPDVKYIESVSFSPDGRFFITNGYNSDTMKKNQYVIDNYIHLWSMYSTDPINTINKKLFRSIALSAFPSNDRILYFYKNDKDVDYAQEKYLDYENGLYTSYKLHAPLTYKDLFTHHGRYFWEGLYKATFSPNGKYVLAFGEGFFVVDVQTGDIISQFPKCSFASFSPDGRYIAYAFDSAFYVCDSLGQNELFRKELSNDVKGVTFTPDNKSVVSMSGNGCIFWDFKTKKPINKISSVYSKFSEICFNHYATDAVLTNGQINTISFKAFRHVKDRKHSKYVLYYPTPPGTVSFSPDDKYLASISSGGISVWKIKDLKSFSKKDTCRSESPQNSSIERQRPWLFIKGVFYTLNYSPDGKYLIASSSDGSYIYDTSRGVELCNLPHCVSASFSPDGKKILSLYNHTIRIWNFPPLQDLIDQTRECIKVRPLTPEERRQYYLE